MQFPIFCDVLPSENKKLKNVILLTDFL